MTLPWIHCHIYFFTTPDKPERAYHDPRLGSIGLRARDIIFFDGSVEKRRLCTASHRMRFWLVPSAAIFIESSHLPVILSAQPDMRRASHPPLLTQSPHPRYQQVICEASSLLSGGRGKNKMLMHLRAFNRVVDFISMRNMNGDRNSSLIRPVYRLRLHASN